MTTEGVPEHTDYGANCPDLLIRQGNDLLLYNSRIPVVKDLNPIVFSNLDEYIEFTRNEIEDKHEPNNLWQRTGTTLITLILTW